MIGDMYRISDDFLHGLLELGLTVEDIQDTIQRKRQNELGIRGVINKIPAREAFEVFIKSLDYSNGHGKQYRPKSRQVYQQVLKDFYEYCMTVDRNLDVQDIAKYTVTFLMDISQRRQFQPSTFNKYAAILRAFIHETADHYNVSKGNLPRLLRLRQHMPQSLSDAEVHRLLELAKGSNYALRSLFMMSFLLGTGLRRDEFRGLRLGDIDFSIPAALVHGKGGVDRIVVIPTKLVPLINSYCDAYGISKPHHSLYSKIGDPSSGVSNNTIDDAARRLFRRLPTYSLTDSSHRYHLHTLRHTYAVQLLKSKVSLRTIAQVLGHKSVSTTQIYTVLDTETLREQLMPGLQKLSQWWGGD